jgi:hypothetical protein
LNPRKFWAPWMLRYYGIRPQDVRSFTLREIEQMFEALGAETVTMEVSDGS